MTAYVDESLRLEGEGLYVLAAVLVPDGRAAAVRATLRDQLRPGQRRFHFRKQSDADRLAMCNAIHDTGVHSVVVTSPVQPSRQERARRHCLVRLLWELDRRAERQVVFETRGKRDILDATLAASAHRSGWTSVPVVARFASPDEECLLWLPDIVAGAVRTAADGDPTLLSVLGAAVAVVTGP